MEVRPDFPTETPPSRELDALVARFMGHEIRRLSEFSPEERAEYASWPPTEWMIASGSVARYLPLYSSRIGDAWPVYLRIRQVDPTAMVGERMVYLAQDEMGPHEIVSGVDAPHAIALAAKFLFEQARAETKQLGETK